jgi:chromate transport protein ChrA
VLLLGAREYIFVALSARIVPYIRKSPWAAAFLDGVNIAALGLMVGVTCQLECAALIDLPTILLALISALTLALQNQLSLAGACRRTQRAGFGVLHIK